MKSFISLTSLWHSLFPGAQLRFAGFSLPKNRFFLHAHTPNGQSSCRLFFSSFIVSSRTRSQSSCIFSRHSESSVKQGTLFSCSIIRQLGALSSRCTRSFTLLWWCLLLYDFLFIVLLQPQITGGHFKPSTATKRTATTTNNTFMTASRKSQRNWI